MGDLLNTTGVLDWAAGPVGSAGSDRVGRDEETWYVRVGDLPALSALVATNTSITETPEQTGTTPAELNVGETVTLTVTFTLGEGVSDNTVLDWTWPAGLEYVSGEVVRVGDELSSSTGLTDGSGADTVGSTSAQFNFGDVTNTANGVLDEGDQVTVEIVLLAVSYTHLTLPTILLV